MSLIDGTHTRAWSRTTGQPQVVPTHWLDHPTLGADFTTVDPTTVDADSDTADGPTVEWTIQQLRDHAAAHDIDLTGLTLKPDILRAVTTADAPADQPTNADGTTAADDTNTTPAAGEKQE